MKRVVRSDRGLNSLPVEEKAYEVRVEGVPGLYVRVQVSGSKSWFYRYYHPVTKKRQNYTLEGGGYPNVPLASAKGRARELQIMVLNGQDPKTYQRRMRSLALSEVASDYLKSREHDCSERHLEKLKRRLELHVFPSLGSVSVNEITRLDVKHALSTLVMQEKFQTIETICRNLNQILLFAANSGLIEKSPLEGVHKIFPKPKRLNFAHLREQELPKLLVTVWSAPISQSTRNLMFFQMHTMSRPGEAASARWEHIDLSNSLWEFTVKKDKHAGARQHRVVLSPYVSELLLKQRQMHPTSEWVFPSKRSISSHMSSSTVNVALKRMGYSGTQTAHGFRHLASTLLNEAGFNSDWVESALAHKTGGVRGVYNKADYVRQREPMMAWWSDYLQTKVSEGFTGRKVEMDSVDPADFAN